MNLQSYCLITASYLLGSICAAVVVAKIMSLPDPRELGSRNPGATNMLRAGGKKAAAITLFADGLKGTLPVLIGQAMMVDDLTLSLVAFAAVVGHCFSIFLRFQGGKGVATGIGALLALSWPVALALIATWLIVAKVLRKSSLAALVAFAALPVFTYILDPVFVSMSIAMAVLVIARHHENIRRLWQGTEN